MKDMAFREQKQHGSLDFPVGYYCVDPQYYQYVMPLHWHREPELVQVRRGTLRRAGSTMVSGPGQNFSARS